MLFFSFGNEDLLCPPNDTTKRRGRRSIYLDWLIVDIHQVVLDANLSLRHDRWNLLHKRNLCYAAAWEGRGCYVTGDTKEGKEGFRGRERKEGKSRPFVFPPNRTKELL